jgi:RNA polymerase sigma-70 factor (ECF subfamily)
MDDASLTARLADDLEGSFEAVVLAHQDRLFSIALRLLGDRADAEEAAQDAFVRAYQALETYAPERRRQLALRPWLATIVVNQARNRRRRAHDRQPPGRLDLLLEAGLEPPDRHRDEPENVGLRRAATDLWASRLLRCPVILRDPVVLRHVDGLSYEEIAAVLQRPVGTIKAQVHRGLANLRAQLEAEAATFEELSA